ncbi:deoxynucleotide monophosphate kinase family protein [Roseibium sp. Sym1]|uniref:deoxynucleotide monophosphate kinase family protein n=1 Tax=Roseibium sp. Sym1 TaxID=3016006 RepID=UPI0022B5898D|nr:hypothetical protein [Roseibium sp. Sym1]
MIVGLSGRMGAGKSTVAGFLVDECGFTRHSMASPLKSMLRCLGLDDRHLYGDMKTTPCDVLGGRTPRYAMQTLGTEWGRKMIDPDLWMNAWRFTLPEGDVVCDDIRFPNEVATIRSLGGILIRIDRSALEVSSHESETHVFDVDHVLENDGSIEQINEKVYHLVLRHLCLPVTGS